jgi:hypothetical protein
LGVKIDRWRRNRTIWERSADERGFPSVVDGKINVGAVSQANWWFWDMEW